MQDAPDVTDPLFGEAVEPPASEGDGEGARIESLPLAERASRYQAAADRLREDLERSDPSRGEA